MKARAVIPSLFYFIIALLFVPGVYGQKINPIVQAAYLNVIDLDFENARNKLKFLPTNPENNPYSIYVANLADVLEVYASGNEEQYNAYRSNENVRLNQINRLSNDTPEKYFLEAEVKLQWAFAKFRFGHYLKAFWGFKQAFSIAQDGHEKFPEYVPLNKSLGVLHTVLGSFPENYHWLLSLLNAEGDISLGMAELRKLRQENSLFYQESIAYQSLFQTYLLNEKEKALLNIEELIQTPKKVMKAVAVLVYFKTAKSSNAEELLLQMEGNNVYNYIPFLQYISGEINLQKGDYPTAIQYYHNFIQSNNGVNYTKDAYLKIALCHWLENDSNFELYKEKARNEGRAEIDADKNAAFLAKQDSLPNKDLLKIRYATDGGYFNMVENILTKIKTNHFNKDEKLEYHYRLARFFHLTGKFTLAIKEYQWVIQHQKDREFYFAPNACLQSAYIFIDQGNLKKAEELLLQIEKYNNHPYKSSIDKKAEIELIKIDPEKYG